MIARRRFALMLGMALVLLAGSSAWLVAADDDQDGEPQDSTTNDTVTVYDDLDDDEGVVISGEIAREIHRAVAEAMAGVDEAMTELRGLSVRVEPLDGDQDRGRVRIHMDQDGDVSEAVIDPIEIQRQVEEALQRADFDHLGVDLEQSMEQLGEELGRMGEELSRAFEDAHWTHDRRQRATSSARDDDQLNAEVRRLRREIRAMEREILRLKAQQAEAGVRDFD